MAYIFERKTKNSTRYYLRQKVNGVRDETYLGTKPPFPKSRGWTNLSAETVERLKQKAKQRATKPAPNPTLPAGKFSVALADPPWRYDFDVDSRATEKHYPTLMLPEIIKYRDNLGTLITDKFAGNCILFLWATAPKLNEALELIQAWGFTYKTHLIWAKDKMGLGWYCRNQHELLLIAEKGTMPLPPPASRPRSIVSAPRTNHSKKPRKIYGLIERAYPGYQYLELFGRDNNRKKWTVWGNGL
ncbi:MAG: MT-A70 family methyltransferase [Bacteroidales bacterium]|nr:MT-A70 family methyltransferase [Bacteroidales bacterium]